MAKRDQPGVWSARKEQAALLIAEDTLTDAAIAAQIGISRDTLGRWKSMPAFTSRVEELLEKTAEAVKAHGVANKTCRLVFLNDLCNRLRRLIEARAKEMAGIPGGGTGLLVLRVRRVPVSPSPAVPDAADPVGQQDGAAAALAGSSRPTVEIVEYVLDVALLRELRATLRQASMEMGEWGKPMPEPDQLDIYLDQVARDLDREQPGWRDEPPRRPQLPPPFIPLDLNNL